MPNGILTNLTENSVGTPFYPFLKNFFKGLKDMCLDLLAHEYHLNWFDQKKGTHG